MKHTTIARACALLTLLAVAPAALAQTPALITCQGRVQTGTPPADFTGTGNFKFALVAGTANISVQATATVTRLANNTLNTFTVTNQGAGYISVPTVTITGGGGTGATATAVLTGDKVTSITLNSPGSGYTSVPTVTIAAPPPRQQQVWVNNGALTADPANAVALTVTNGLYSVMLGDTSLTNMAAIPPAVFARSDVRLRVWFNGTQLSPDQRLAANGYLPGGTTVNGDISVTGGLQATALELRAPGQTPYVDFSSGTADYDARLIYEPSNDTLNFAGINALNVQTNLGYGFVHTDGVREVGTYVSSFGGWFGTRSAHPLHFFTNDGNAQVTLSTAGNLGIGESSPTQARLVIMGGITNPGFTGTYLQAAGGSVTPVGHGAHDLSIYATGGIVSTEGVYAISDTRTKVIRGRSDSAADLTALRAIEITDYHFKDQAAKGDKAQKKIIAQQVEKILPQAVSQMTDVVPDIFQSAPCKDGWVELKTDLRKGERVRLTDDKTTQVFEVLEVKNDKFRTGFTPPGDKVFVYGREVKDFRIVDYDAIAMLNVSATQELARKLEAKDAELTALQKENAALKAALAANAAQDQAQDAKLAALAALLEKHSASATTAGVSTVPAQR